MSPVITLRPEAREIEVPKGEVLGDALVRAGIPLNLYCGKKGVCGRCFVEIVAGEQGEVGTGEIKLRELKKLPENYRLACRYIVIGDLTIEFPASSLLPRMPILSRGGLGREITPDPALKKISFLPPHPSLASPDAYLDLLREVSLGRDVRIEPEVLRRTALLLCSSSEQPLTAVLYDERDVLDIEPGDTTSNILGAAIDLGTTTLVVDLIDLVSGAVLGTAAGLNGQSSYGADVVSRLTAAYQSPAKLEEMKAAVVRSLNGLLEELYGRLGVAPASVYETVVAGNTAMSHLFVGMPVESLAVAPFAPIFSSFPSLKGSDSGLSVNPHGRVTLVPNIKSFVGGDISSGLTAVDFADLDGNYLFVDLGTNGEIALKTDRRVLVTSTAAGPAFEGMNLSCGMLALPGAIQKAFRSASGVLNVETVGGLAPRGVCGTGLIDLVAAFLESGALAPGGAILDPSRRLDVAPGVSLSQQDVREMQLASAAVKSGLRMILESENLAVSDLDGFFVAGAFGTSLDIENAMRIGLLPRMPLSKLVFLGNASLAGARAILLSRAERQRAERLARAGRHLALARGEDFQTRFIDALEFREWTIPS